MKGIEVSDREMDLARQFLQVPSGQPWPESEDGIMLKMSRGQLVRLIAWWGAVRSEGDSSGQLWVDGKPLIPAAVQSIADPQESTTDAQGGKSCE